MSDMKLQRIEVILEAPLDAKILVSSLELLQAVSIHKQTDAETEPSLASLVPTFTTSSNEDQDQLRTMVRAAKRAHQYVQNFTQATQETRLRLILSYITLHLTLNFSVAGSLCKEGLTKGDIRSEKWKVFYEQLGGEEGLHCPMQRLKDNVGYGKMLRTWVKHCGILWLPVLAVIKSGIVRFLKDHLTPQGYSAVIRRKLITQDSWIHSKPLYQSESNNSDMLNFDNSGVGTIFDVFDIEIPSFPYQDDEEKAPVAFTRVNMIAWVLNAEAIAVVDLNAPRYDYKSPIMIYAGELASLFSTMTVTNRVISFLSNSGILEEAMKVLFDSRISFDAIEYLILPIETENPFFLCVCGLDRHSISVFYWRQYQDSEETLKNILSDLGKLSFFQGWNISVHLQDPSGDEMQLTKREISLLLIDSIHLMMRRSAHGERKDGMLLEDTLNQIILGSLKAVYGQDLRGEECILASK
ncbi:hypothetical protein B9Z19DRAFT_1120915 [Tuber borchii]|uniref:Uncharacterized protein n=1 Tax=Tuber borchii TaxID=42251 RepID=A0A2T7A3N4_TUBBO|nr:hypothetical protein B9Z19DRAFT_1120915 [Tuber borchii]